jgi:hypothetical protein
MLNRAWLMVAVLCTGCERERTPTIAESAPSGAEQLVNRVWTQSATAGLPGVMRIFLSDGTLVQDSCWETHRLSRWSLGPAGVLTWDEDGRSITADLVAVDEQELVLRLHLVGGAVEDQRFVPAGAPYVCPDLPR